MPAVQVFKRATDDLIERMRPRNAKGQATFVDVPPGTPTTTGMFTSEAQRLAQMSATVPNARSTVAYMTPRQIEQLFPEAMADTARLESNQVALQRRLADKAELGVIPMINFEAKEGAWTAQGLSNREVVAALMLKNPDTPMPIVLRSSGELKFTNETVLPSSLKGPGGELPLPEIPQYANNPRGVAPVAEQLDLFTGDIQQIRDTSHFNVLKEASDSDLTPEEFDAIFKKLSQQDAFRPTNTRGVFLGKKAVDKVGGSAGAGLKMAERMRAEGATVREIEQATAQFFKEQGSGNFALVTYFEDGLPRVETVFDDFGLDLDMLRQGGEFAMEEVASAGLVNLMLVHPELRNIKVANKFLSGRAGEFKPRAQKMYLNLVGGQQNEETALHELMHAIQGLENFASGGSPGMFIQGGMDKVTKLQNVQLEALLQEMDKETVRGALVPLLDEATLVNATPQELLAALDNVVFGDKRTAFNTPVTMKLNELNDPDLDRVMDLMEGLDSLQSTKLKAFNQYSRLHGEAEARLLERRFDFSLQQRRERSPQATFKLESGGDAIAIRQNEPVPQELIERIQ